MAAWEQNITILVGVKKVSLTMCGLLCRSSNIVLLSSEITNLSKETREKKMWSLNTGELQ